MGVYFRDNIMITSTSTAIQDFNFLESLGDIQPAGSTEFETQNAQIRNLVNKYGSIEAFKEAYRKAINENNFNSNLPITTMAEDAMSSAPNLRELPTGDAGQSTGKDEALDPNIGYSKEFGAVKARLPVIDNIGADANVLGETVIYEKDNKFFTYDNSGKLIDEGNLPDQNQKGFLENQKDKLKKTLTKIEQSLADPDASRPTGLEELEQPIIAYLQGRVDLGDLSLADQGKVMSKEFQDAMRDKKVAQNLGMKVGLLGLTTDQKPELAKRQEILAMAERMNPNDPDAGRKALDEYLLGQKTKLDDQDKVINVEEYKVTPLDDSQSKFKGETPKDPEPVRKKINPNNLVDGIKNKDVADDTKNTIVENAPSSLKKLAKNFGDALFDPDNKGGIAAIFIGANMMNEANFGDAITKGLAQTSDFLQATGGKASDKQVVELADGRIVLVNKKTGAIEDTGEKGKGTEEPASIKALRIKADALGIDFDDLIRFDLLKSDKTKGERIENAYFKILNSRILAGLGTDEAQRREIYKEAEDIINIIDSGGEEAIETLLKQEP